jgi:hypothetical protein
MSNKWQQKDKTLTRVLCSCWTVACCHGGVRGDTLTPRTSMCAICRFTDLHICRKEAGWGGDAETPHTTHWFFLPLSLLLVCVWAKMEIVRRLCLLSCLEMLLLLGGTTFFSKSILFWWLLFTDGEQEYYIWLYFVRKPNRNIIGKLSLLNST